MGFRSISSNSPTPHCWQIIGFLSSTAQELVIRLYDTHKNVPLIVGVPRHVITFSWFPGGAWELYEWVCIWWSLLWLIFHLYDCRMYFEYHPFLHSRPLLSCKIWTTCYCMLGHVFYVTGKKVSSKANESGLTYQASCTLFTSLSFVESWIVSPLLH